MAWDDEHISSQARISAISDERDMQEVYDTERRLLYVACTRVRDHLIVTSVEPEYEFLDDMTQRIGLSPDHTARPGSSHNSTYRRV